MTKQSTAPAKDPAVEAHDAEVTPNETKRRTP
jgi:hypothetical protein